MGYTTQVDKMDIFTLNTGERPREENFEVEEWVKNLALVKVYRWSLPLWDDDWIVVTPTLWRCDTTILNK